MGSLTFEEIRNRGLLLYEFVRGSRCHGLETPLSDWDYGGVFYQPILDLIGLQNHVEQINSKKNDTTWYEAGKFFQLLLKSNPTILESLFIDDEFVIFEHPVITELKKHRDEFVTKECFPGFSGYAFQQIKKARSANKLVTNPIKKRLWPLDFCYVFNGQDSVNIRSWLEKHNMKQEHCALSKMNHMKDGYSVYYDDPELGCNYGFRGIVDEDGNSTAIRSLQSIPKGLEPICYITYNEDGYSTHCREWREQQETLKNRNPIRYDVVVGKNYDAKNMCECFRLMNMGIEIASGKGVNVNRKGIDREFLLDIKNGKYDYDTIMEMAVKKEEEMNKVMADSKIPNKIDFNVINDYLVKLRTDVNYQYIPINTLKIR